MLAFPKKYYVVLFALLLFVLVACAPSSEPAGPAPQSSTEPAGSTPTLNPDAQFYADEYGISLEEAGQRLEWQSAIGELNATLEANEAETFAGLWIEHEPEFKIVVAFTENGEETLAPYIAGRPFAAVVEVREYEYSWDELRAVQQELTAAIEALEPLNFSSGVDVQNNRVTLTVANPAALLAELETAGYTLPPMVVVEAIDPGNIPDDTRGGVTEYTGPDGQTIYFPRQGPAVAYMDALLEGTLALDEAGCLRMEYPGMGADGELGPLVIWHYDFTLHVEGDAVEVLNGAGEVVARVGEEVRMGGGFGSEVALPGMPLEACPGPYWILGSIETLEAQAIPDIDVYFVAGDGDAVRAVFYSQSKPAGGEAGITGVLTVEEGCFRVGDYTILWPPDIWPNEDADPLQVVYRRDGVEALIVTVGEEVTLPGQERGPGDYRFFENKVNCAGPYWGVGLLQP